MIIQNPLVNNVYQYISNIRAYSTCKTLAAKVAKVANENIQALYLLSLMGNKIVATWLTEGKEAARNLLPSSHDTETNQEFCLYIRRLFSKTIEISPANGLDPRVDAQHFALQLADRQDLPRLAPNADILALKELFERINLLNPDDPHYFDAATLALDDDTPATFDQLNVGLSNALEGISTGNEEQWSIFNGSLVKPLLQDIFYLLTTDPERPEAETTACLIDLAKAGFRKCHTRMYSECNHWNERLRQEVIVQTLPELIGKTLQSLRRKILTVEMARGDVHILNEYLISIGSKIGVPRAGAAYNDDPFLMRNLAPQYALPDFLHRYTHQIIIQNILSAVNDTPRLIPVPLITDWFLEHIPADYQPEEESRAENYMLQHVFEFESSRVKLEAVEYMLIQMNILN
jgi:hypothetical protein